MSRYVMRLELVLFRNGRTRNKRYYYYYYYYYYYVCHCIAVLTVRRGVYHCIAWLPVKFRRQYKMATLAYNNNNNNNSEHL